MISQANGCFSIFQIPHQAISTFSVIINVKTFNELQQSEYYQNRIWSNSIALSCIGLPIGTLQSPVLAYIVYGKMIKPFYIMLLWHISASRRHSKILLGIMPTRKMLSQHSTLLYIYITKNCDSMSLFPVFYCFLLSY